jgi:alpha-1,3-rhamnosyl/mannosyltransferase
MGFQMHILVNAIPLKGLLTGISRYVRQLYTEMERIPGVRISYHDGLRLLDKMPRQAEPARWARFTGAVWSLPDLCVFLLRVAFWYNYERRLRSACRSHHFDIYHETTFFPSAVRSVPQVQTIYDLSLIKYPSAHPRERVMYFNYMNPRRWSFAARRIAISEFIKKEICEHYGIPPWQVTAIPLAAAAGFYKRPDALVEAVLRQLGLPDDFMLSVGSLEPRKNLQLLVEALKTAKTEMPIVLTGWEGWGQKNWLSDLAGTELKKRIFLTGYTTDEELACLYSAAKALVYPSLYEGFGLPILEAMACGCPVICSNAASLPEVAGEAAILVDPHDAKALALAITDISGNPSLRESLIQKGLQREALFDWKAAAQKTLEVFRDVQHCA